ncbi:MAG: hypothetical protein H0U71_09175 [Gammaproteobacteria bacterium]|nr:hypothetical protein [Gammaproteobacteria bacterium]
MVKQTHKFTHDSTLASEINQKIHESPLALTLTKAFPFETKRFFHQLMKLNSSDQGNQIPSIMGLLIEYHHNCNQYRSLGAKGEEIRNFFKGLMAELNDLRTNIDAYHIAINCAVDGYTLNSTTYLILTLQSFIEKKLSLLEKSTSLEEVSRSKKTALKMKPKKRLPKEINLANDLKCTCEEIRQQIGSAETMPKGLVIFLVMHLCDAIHTCEEWAAEYNQELIDCIHHEIEHIRQLYPELAQAGEDLQKAIANYPLQK